ncbi:cryptochrome/photolyase family protein [Pandoraea apista]|uniref:cryptochrome/photolyase family protein n=1 Tax=Pandoraea apista TaxID=93218 RepID=UPI0005A8D3D1|nr:deoxyribodipyrimidine photo-lyase [Pandoraea apista]AJE99357.2 deoxyribodipyrimidine photolyase [Pandoraea apista]AKH73466.1 deoxyribodipyrimidine photolyase [Pandoraea apista]AKI62013.1 deoxyribodipyrimidine photolyase [Pandoraea apista]
MSEFQKGLVWMRRDLRCTDNATLTQALNACREVYAVFVFDTTILEGLPTNDRRVAFIHESVAELARTFETAGGALIVRHGDPTVEIPSLAKALGVQAVFSGRDYEPAAVARDRSVAHLLDDLGIAFETVKDQVIFEANEILTAQGEPYSVFTPYQRAWLKQVRPVDLAPHGRKGDLQRLAVPPGGAQPLPSLASMGFEVPEARRIAIPAGESGARQLLEDFLPRMAHYHEWRDYPAVRGPSYLSVHLRFGTISIRTLAREAHQAMLKGGDGGSGAQTWLSELIWREFYFMILHHHPEVVGRAFKPAYDAIEWASGKAAEANFQAWCEGRTGYPLVDAAMRQINQTGYMHNRLRMVTASFLVKDLGIDWRRGEAYFARALNDFDLAANNGGWQWAASTGCDAQPYFRIFNPVTQSEKFDPQGRFIRKYVPELAGLPDKALHAPWRADAQTLLDAKVTLGRDYPQPLVAHDVARKETLARYAVVKTPAVSSDNDDTSSAD